MNEFVSWCRHLLVSFLFHALTSLHPPSFYRNDFSTLYNRKGKTEDEEGKHVVPKSYVVARRIILFSSVSLPTPCGYRRRPGILNCSDINIMQ